MNKLIARFFFCAIPALLIGGIVGFFSASLGMLVLAAVFGLGVNCTAPKSERGEYD